MRHHVDSRSDRQTFQRKEVICHAITRRAHGLSSFDTTLHYNRLIVLWTWARSSGQRLPGRLSPA